MAYRIYRSDDPGAIAAGLPILPRVDATVSATQLITILDAVLVNGYAGKPAAGWSKPFATDGTKHLYLSGSTTGAALRIDAGTSSALIDVSCIANPTSLNTTSIIGMTGFKAGTRSGGAWVIFADDKSFMIYSRGDTALSLTGGPWNLHYFGEVTNFENQASALGICCVGSNDATSTPQHPIQWSPSVASTTAAIGYPVLRVVHSSAAIAGIRVRGGPFFVGNGSAQFQVPLASTGGKVLSSDVFLTTNNSLLSKFRGLKTLESAFWGASNPLDVITLDGKKYAIIYVYSTEGTSVISSSITSEAMFLVEVE